MTTRLRHQALGFLFGSALAAGPAYAGPLQPCITATLSANGNILVVNDLTFDDQDESHARLPQTSTFRVLRRNVDVNEGDRLRGPNAYWAEPLWSVVLTRGGTPAINPCPYTLVSDDGEYLILFDALSWRTALSIYRRRDHPGQPFGGPGPDHGILVRQVPLTDLWPLDQIPKTITDATPQWFSGGTFAFSPDGKTLIHKTRWGKTLQISLQTGAVTAQ